MILSEGLKNGSEIFAVWISIPIQNRWHMHTRTVVGEPDGKGGLHGEWQRLWT